MKYYLIDKPDINPLKSRITEVESEQPAPFGVTIELPNETTVIIDAEFIYFYAAMLKGVADCHAREEKG